MAGAAGAEAEASPPQEWRLASGLELVGEFESSALAERPCLVRRQDGQVIQLSPLVYAIASCLDGGAATLDEISAATSARTGRSISRENVEYLIEKKLVPLGVVGTGATDATPGAKLPRSRALLALRFRTRVVPERVHRHLSTTLRPLFRLPVVVLVLCALDLLRHRHCAGRDRAGAAARDLASHPALLLLVTALLFASAAIHELGHATATRYGGATPGVMGVGVYLVWPVFYTDVSDAYRLDRRSRLRVDLGGVYFNALVIATCSGIYLATHYLPLLVFVVVAQLQALYQFVPFVRMDGYWILSDLVGVPNLFAYVAPVLASLRRHKDPRHLARLAHVRPWARRMITVWVGLTVAILGINAAIIVVTGPRLLTTDLVAFHQRAVDIAGDFTRGNVAGGLDDVTSLILLAIPAAGIALIAALLSLRTARTVRRWWPERRLQAIALAAVGLVALAAFASEFVPKEIARPLEGGTGGSYWDNTPTQSGGAVPPGASTAPKLATISGGSEALRHRSTRPAAGGVATAPGPSIDTTPSSTVPPAAVPLPHSGGASSTGVAPSGATVTTPTVKTTGTTTITVPSVTTPTVKATVTTPSVTTPTVTTPTVTTPTVTTPTVTTPTVTVPTVTVPTVTVPTVTVPTVTVPTVTVTVPTVTIPTVTTPTVTIPTVTTPTVTIPTVTTPTVKTTVTTPSVTLPPTLP